MPTDPPIRGAPTFQDLLVHASWLRRLAVSLVGAGAQADDVIQDTWEAVLARPAAIRDLRPWLSTVLRNFVRQRARAARNRRRREAGLAALAEKTLPSPEALLARHETLQLLSEDVRRLDEPYRSTVLLRYVDELSPTEIARRQGLPAGTVRWRLKRALDNLREALDKRHGGDRRSWTAAVIMSAQRSGVTQPSCFPATLKGAVLMKVTKSNVALVVAVLVLATGTGMWAWLGGTHMESRRHEARVDVHEQNGAPFSGVGQNRPTNSEIAGATQASSQREVPGVNARPKPPRFEEPARKQWYPTHGPPHNALTPFDLAFNNAMPKIKACYGDLLDREPDAVGRFSLRFTVIRDGYEGRVDEATIAPPKDGKDELVAPLMQQCMLLALQESKFPAPTGDKEEHIIPFQFGGLTAAERARRGLPPRRTDTIEAQGK
jgi:RNA polymerase sigma factor (sigma-70 family)